MADVRARRRAGVRVGRAGGAGAGAGRARRLRAVRRVGRDRADGARLGFGNAAIYYINKRELALRDVVSAAHVVTLGVAGDHGGASSASIAPWAGDGVLGDDVSPWLLDRRRAGAALPALLRVMLQALSRFVDMGVATIGAAARDAGARRRGRTRSAIRRRRASSAFWIVSNAAAAAYRAACARRRAASTSAQIVRPRLATCCASSARFGVQGEAGNVLQLLNYRLDQYIVRGVRRARRRRHLRRRRVDDRSGVDDRERRRASCCCRA